MAGLIMQKWRGLKSQGRLYDQAASEMLILATAVILVPWILDHAWNFESMVLYGWWS